MPDDAGDFLRRNVHLDLGALKDAIDAALADGYSGGSLAVLQQLPAGANPGAAALFGPDLRAAWDQWAPGNVDTAALLDNGGFKALLDRSSITIKGIADTTYDRMGTILADGASSGASVGDISNQLYDILGDELRADTIANTELARATTAASLDTFRANDVTSWEWVLSPDACPECQDKEESNPHHIDDEPPPLHPNCRCAVSPVDTTEA